MTKYKSEKKIVDKLNKKFTFAEKSSEVIHKTIEGISTDSRYIIMKFTDGTYAVYFNNDPYDFGNKLRPPKSIAEFREIGIIDSKQVDEYMNEIFKNREQEKIKRQRRSLINEIDKLPASEKKRLLKQLKGELEQG